MTERRHHRPRFPGAKHFEAIEGDAMPAMLAESDAFVDLTDPELDGRWLDFKAAAATNADGQMIGYGTDAGPEGICYRSDLFKKAGLPTDRDEVAALMGTWDDYFATGEEFKTFLLEQDKRVETTLKELGLA